MRRTRDVSLADVVIGHGVPRTVDMSSTRVGGFPVDGDWEGEMRGPRRGSTSFPLASGICE